MSFHIDDSVYKFVATRIVNSSILPFPLWALCVLLELNKALWVKGDNDENKLEDDQRPYIYKRNH